MKNYVTSAYRLDVEALWWEPGSRKLTEGYGSWDGVEGPSAVHEDITCGYAMTIVDLRTMAVHEHPDGRPYMVNQRTGERVFGVRFCSSCHPFGKEEAQARRRARQSTACRRGHEMTTANTYVRPDGSRRCRTCLKDRATERRTAA